MTILTTLQYAVPTLHGGNQSPGVPWRADGDGAILYRARMRSWVLDWILHTRRYVIAFPLTFAAGLCAHDDLFTYSTAIQYTPNTRFATTLHAGQFFCRVLVLFWNTSLYSPQSRLVPVSGFNFLLRRNKSMDPLRGGFPSGLS